MGQPPYTATAAQPRWCAETKNSRPTIHSTQRQNSTTHSDRTAQYGKDRAAQYSRGRAAPYSRQQRRNSTAAEISICSNTERLSDFVTTAAAQQHTAIEEL